MKRIFLLSLLVLMLLAWTVPAAASRVTDIQSNTTFATDGSAQVSLTVHLHLTGETDSLHFPVPAQARHILLNGGSAQTLPGEDTLLVQLPRLQAGSYSFAISYQLPLAVHRDEKTEVLSVELPLLSGFSLPIDAMAFTVTLPEPITSSAAFVSGYYQESIETRLTSATAGNTISGTVDQSLKDHETLLMTLPVEDTMFPDLSLTGPLLSGWEAAVLVFTALAILYYLLCLLPVAPRKVRCFTAPEGISAGEVGTCLTGCGADLTMMVFSWAQLGYLRIELSDKRVSLVKSMDMGNERSEFEVRVFNTLFKGRTVVAGTSYHYARTCRNVAASSSMLRQIFKPTSGNPRIFRILVGIAGTASGVCLAMEVGQTTGAQVMLSMLFALLCGFFSYCIQAGGKCLPLRDKSPLVVSLLCSAAWLLLGLFTGQFAAAMGMMLFQSICGFAAAYGGQRSERGKRCLAELLSLRRFMVSTPAGELQRMLQVNPNYFFELAPYALAMGVDKKFAKKFGREHLLECSFLSTGSEREMTAAQVAQLMRQAADTLNALQKRLPYERLRGK